MRESWNVGDAFTVSQLLLVRFGQTLDQAVPLARGNVVECYHGLPRSMIDPAETRVVHISEEIIDTATGRLLAAVGQCPACWRVFYRPHFFH